MSHQSDLIATDIDAYLAQHERKELLRLLTCGSVDDGKSTLIGRLLHDSKMIYEDQLEAITADSIKSGTTGEEVDLALLVDGLQAEREQGITIDVAYRYFSTAQRKFIIADTPGHEQYTRNMATGASTCDLAIILVDARYGVQTQTKRHSFIAGPLLGIKHIVVAINKMDLVDFSETVYNDIKQDYLEFAADLNIADLHFLPMSALKGDNVVNISEHTPWFDGVSLMELLETIEIAGDHNFDDMRFPVQYVNRPNLDFRGFCGTVAAGVVRKGDEVMALPSRKTSRIKDIVTYDGNLDEAFPPMAITITLEDEIDISRGDMLVKPDNLPDVGRQFEANIVWMAEHPLQPGHAYNFKQSTNLAAGTVSGIRHRVDVNTLEEFSANKLQLNEIGLCEINLNKAIAFDPYSRSRGTGSFVIVDRLSNATVGAGMIVRAVDGGEETLQSVSADEKQIRYGYQPVTIAMTGEQSRAVALGVERVLFDSAHPCITLTEESDFDSGAQMIEIAGLINRSGFVCVCALTKVSVNDGQPAIKIDTTGKAVGSAVAEVITALEPFRVK